MTCILWSPLPIVSLFVHHRQCEKDAFYERHMHFADMYRQNGKSAAFVELAALLMLQLVLYRSTCGLGWCRSAKSDLVAIGKSSLKTE